MADQSPNVIKALLSSKKAIMCLASIVGLIAVHLGGLTEAAATQLSQQIMTIAGIYLGSQGVADAGRAVGAGMNARSE